MYKREVATRLVGGVLWLCALCAWESAGLALHVSAQDKTKDGAALEKEDSVEPPNDEATDDQEPQKADENAKDAVPAPGIMAPPPPPPSGLATPPIVKVGGAVILYYRHSLVGQTAPGYKDVFEVYRGQVLIDGKLERFGLHLDFRVRDTLLKPFFKGTAWVEEAYAFAELIQAESEYGPLTLKVGKIYQQFGRFWDGSFYGNVHLRDGLKIDPDYGLSLEGELWRAGGFGAKYFFQYFVVDGGTNSSNVGRDTFSDMVMAGAVAPRRRNMAIGRIEPFVKLGDFTVLRLGLSAEHFTASDLAVYGDQGVTRLGSDVTVQVGPFSAWGEYTRQNGRSTTDFPYAPMPMAMPAVAGRSYDSANYLLFGGQVTYDRFTARYNFSQGDYLNVPNAALTGYDYYRESTHVPGVMVKAYDWLFVLVELALYQRYTPGRIVVIDKSLNITIHGRV